MCPIFFFFSSRRRHTRWNCDWSSDVCSSDLPLAQVLAPVGWHRVPAHQVHEALRDRLDRRERVVDLMAQHADQALPRLTLLLTQRTTDICQDEQLVRAPALPERVAPQLPPAVASWKGELHDPRPVRRQALGELQL